MLMPLKTLAAGQSQRHPSTLNGGFPPGSRNWWRQNHHERAEAGSITRFSHKAPTSSTAESPSTVRNTPLCLPGGCRACRGLKERNLCTCSGFWQKGSGLGALQAGGKYKVVVSSSLCSGQPWVCVKGRHSCPSGEMMSWKPQTRVHPC